MRVRQRLGERGFTFEYSATFGQALNAAKKDALTAAYQKSIVFDYSYPHFYADGYGKDFLVANLQTSKWNDAAEYADLLLTGNLLAFYEQLLYYREASAQLRPYNIEKPLWVFVGSKVNAVYTAHGTPRSDVLTIAQFLHRVLQNGGWASLQSASLLAGSNPPADPANPTRRGTFSEAGGGQLGAGRGAALFGAAVARRSSIFASITASATAHTTCWILADVSTRTCSKWSFA